MTPVGRATFDFYNFIWTKRKGIIIISHCNTSHLLNESSNPDALLLILSVLNAIIRLSPADLFWGLVWTILFFGCYLVGPAFILPALIRFLQDVDGTPAWHGWLLVMGLLLCALMQAVSYPNYHILFQIILT